jgi:hypothetical protein
MKQIFALFFIGLFSLSCNNAQKSNSADRKEEGKENNFLAKIESRIFKNDTVAGSNLTGFGYDILVDGKLYIHQPHIPSISGSTGFLSQDDAHKTADYVADKLRETNALPSLSKQDLDNLGIKY